MYRFESFHGLDRDLCGRNEYTQQHRLYPLAEESSISVGEGRDPGYINVIRCSQGSDLTTTYEFCRNPFSKDIPPKSLQGFFDVRLGSINLARVRFVQEPVESIYGSVRVVRVH